MYRVKPCKKDKKGVNVPKSYPKNTQKKEANEERYNITKNRHKNLKIRYAVFAWFQ